MSHHAYRGLLLDMSGRKTEPASLVFALYCRTLRNFTQETLIVTNMSESK